MRNYWGWTAEQRDRANKYPFKRWSEWEGAGTWPLLVSAPETFAKGIGNPDKRPFSAGMGSRPKFLISSLFWGGLEREIHPNSYNGSSVTLENRAGTLTEPDGGKFSSPVMWAERRSRFGSRSQALFLFVIHIKGKMWQSFILCLDQGIFKYSPILNSFYIV